MMVKAKKTAAPVRIPAEEIPYAIPVNWQWVRLGNFCEFERGITFPASAKENVATEANIPCLRTANVQEKLELGNLIYVDKKYMKGNDAKLVREGDVIMSSANSLELVGKVSFVERVPFPMTFGGFVLNIRACNILNWYLFYFLRSEFLAGHFIRKSTQTTNIANINTKTLDAWKLPLPPLAEQERIVARIEELFEKLDAAEEKLRAVVEDSSARRAALLRRAFTGALTKNWRAAHGRTMDTWEEKKLGDCGTWQGGGTPSKSHPEYWENGDLLWVTSKDMKAKIIEDTQLHINQKGVENSSATYVEKPSLLFVMRSGILRHTLPVAMVKKPFTVNQDLKVLTPDSDELEFLYWACKAHADDIRSTCMKSGTTVESISAPALMNYKIPVPPLDEQKEIVRLLDELLAREDEARAAAEAALAKIPALRQAVLARAFRGALGTNDPAEPPALSE